MNWRFIIEDGIIAAIQGIPVSLYVTFVSLLIALPFSFLCAMARFKRVPLLSQVITVITSRPQEIADALMDALERGCTLIKSRGAYAKQEGESVICVVDRKQFYKAKKVIYGIDKQAFVIVSEAKEVYGEGFLDSDWEV